MTHRPRTFTFYSYKGGVGRSMALLNVAYTLQSLGRHVLIVDLDLEAPGVSGFLRRNDELAPHPEDQPDVVDLLLDVLPLARWGLGSAGRPELPVLPRYLRAVKETNFAPAQNPRFSRTRLDVLCASDERDYAARLSALDIAHLTADELAETGNLLREIFFRHQFTWSRLPGGENEPTCYDYILIDSRTGFTETSGLCIGPLADRLVLFCGLNDQNINGTAEFLKVVGLQPGTRTVAWDDADDITDTAHAPSLGHKPSLVVASPVPAGEMELKEQRFQIMEQTLGLRPQISISYHPRLSVLETVFLRQAPQEVITQEYRRLTHAMLALVGDHPSQLQEKFQSFRSPSVKTTSDTPALLRYAAMLDAEPLAQLASLQTFMANGLSNQAKQKTGAEADALFTAAGEKYAAALAIKPDKHEALNNWGTALSDQAKQKTGAEAEGLFAAAGEKYAAALAIKPDQHGALSNWGVALSELAKPRSEAEADALFTAAGAKYAAALAIKPDQHDALNNWGNALLEQAKQKTGAEAEGLFTAAGEKLVAALAIKPDDHEVLFNLACLAALRGNIAGCLQWLERAAAEGYAMSQSKVDGDADFDKVRAAPEFLAFRAKLPG